MKFCLLMLNILSIKNILLLSCISTLGMGCISHSEQVAYYNKVLGINQCNGRVMSVEDSLFTATEKFGEVIKGSFSKRELSKFDKNGLCIEKNEFNLLGELTTKTKYRYDSIGYIIEMNDYLPSGRLFRKSLNQFLDGILIKQNVYDSTGLAIGFTTYIYNDSFNISKLAIYKLTPVLNIENVTSYYNEVIKPEGHFMTEKEFRDFVSDKGQAELFFNDVVGPSGDFNSFEEFKSFLGLCNSTTLPQIERISLLDASGEIMSNSNFICGLLDVSAKYVYNTKDGLVAINIYDKTGKLYSNERYAYTYDNSGNWKSKVIYEDAKPTSLIIRNVKYY